MLPTPIYYMTQLKKISSSLFILQIVLFEMEDLNDVQHFQLLFKPHIHARLFFGDFHLPNYSYSFTVKLYCVVVIFHPVFYDRRLLVFHVRNGRATSITLPQSKYESPVVTVFLDSERTRTVIEYLLLRNVLFGRLENKFVIDTVLWPLEGNYFQSSASSYQPASACLWSFVFFLLASATGFDRMCITVNHLASK